VPGPLGYVWPGAGLAAYQGSPAGLPPGYQSPFPGGNPSGAPLSWYQEEGDSYSPFGAVLTSTDHQNVVDLIFALNFSQPQLLNLHPVVAFSRLYIYIPPEFTGILWQDVVTTITNQYDDISVYTAGPQDPFGPGWTIIEIVMRPPYDVVFTAPRYDEWYYVRVNGVVAPTIAGRYFFKMLLAREGENFERYPADFTSSEFYVPIQNWPVLLVKGELDPAIISGTIKYGGWNSQLYGLPITLPGRVRAVGIATNPYTGESTGRPVEARAYFNGTASGHYELEGLAPGIYDIYAAAAGYPEQKIATNISILTGQSLNIDGYLQPGPVIEGEVYSKSEFGEEPWAGLRPIRIEIYSVLNSTNAGLFTESPWDKGTQVPGIWTSDNGPRMSYDWIQGFGALPRRVSLEWLGPIPYYSDGTKYNGFGPICGLIPDPCSVQNGVGSAQFWWVDPNGVYTNGGGPTRFIFKFGSKGFFGVPTDIDGHVPQALATWTNGLTPGTYHVRAFVNGYVQTELDGTTFADYSFQVSADDWAGDILVPLDLRIGGIIQKTIHFHDLNGTLEDNPVPSYRRMVVELTDSSNRIIAFNFTVVSPGQSSSTVLLDGLGMAGYNTTRWSLYGWRSFGYEDYGIPSGTYQLSVYIRGYLEDAPETVSVKMDGVTTSSDHVYRGAIFSVSVRSVDWEQPLVQRPWKYPDDAVNVYFQGPTVLGRNWGVLTQSAGTAIIGPLEFDGYEYDDIDLVTGSLPGGYGSGNYSIIGYTYGYVQREPLQIYAVPGAVSDIVLDLTIGTSILLTLKFRKENLLSVVPFNMSLRIRVFNNVGQLVGAYVTSPYLAGTGFRDQSGRLLWYVPGSTETMEVEIAGIPFIYNDPVYGFYGQTMTGISGFPDYSGNWSIEVDTVNWYQPSQFYPPAPGLLMGESYHLIPGRLGDPLGWTGQTLLLPDNHLGPFSQSGSWSISNGHLGGEVSAIFALDLNSYLSGNISGFTWSDELRTLSGVKITASGTNGVFSSPSIDGFYEIYLPTGSYEVYAVAWANDVGYRTQSMAVKLGPSSFSQGVDFYLQRSEIPIPEIGWSNGMLILLVPLALVFSKRLKKSAAAHKS